MNFLNPSLLWLSPLVAAPIVLHMLFVHRAPVVPFSSLFLLRRAFQQNLPRRRLEQWLLLLLRCLALAALIAAFSRPVVRLAGVGASGNQGARIVVLLDASYSMGYRVAGRERFSLAKEAGETILKSLAPEDKVAVGVFSDRWEGPPLDWSPDLAAARQRLRGAARTSRTTDLRPALVRAFDLLAREQAGPKAVLILSDQQQNAFSNLPQDGDLAELPGFDKEVLVVGTDFEAHRGNRSLVSVEPSRDDAVARGRLQVRLATFGEPPPGGGVTLWDGDRSRGWQPATNAPRGGALFDLPRQEGWNFGRVSLTPDSLPEDNDFFFAVDSPRTGRILVLYSDPKDLEPGGAGAYLHRLLEPQGAPLLPYRSDFRDTLRPQVLSPDAYSAVILVGHRRISPELGNSLRDFVRRGGGLWALPPSGVEAGGWVPIEDLLPAGLGLERRLSGGSSLALADAPAARPHGFRWNEFDWKSLGVRKAFEVRPKAKSKTWFRIDSRPFLLEAPFGKGRVFLSAASLTPDNTNLPLKPAFLPFVEVLLAKLSGQTVTQRAHQLLLGEPFERRWPLSDSAPLSAKLTIPGVEGQAGRTIRVRVQDRRLLFADTDRPGVYTLRYRTRAGETVEHFAVNLDRRSGEGNLSQGGSPWPLVSLADPQTEFTRLLRGIEVSSWLLGLALLFLVLESALAARRLPAAAALLLLLVPNAFAQNSPEAGTNHFRWTQIRTGGHWDPYPSAHDAILSYLDRTTAILISKERSTTDLTDAAVFDAPFLVLAGKQAPPPLKDRQIDTLRRYLTSGGFLWIEDASATRYSAFDRWVQETMRAVFPDRDLKPLDRGHALFRSFYLVDSPGGRNLVDPSLRGVDWGRRTVVVYSRNDLLGSWIRDGFGKPLYPCTPGGERQRLDAVKTTTNIVLYALTGTYKLDAVHQTSILRKLRSQ